MIIVKGGRRCPNEPHCMVQRDSTGTRDVAEIAVVQRYWEGEPHRYDDSEEFANEYLSAGWELLRCDYDQYVLGWPRSRGPVDYPPDIKRRKEKEAERAARLGELKRLDAES